MTLRRAAGARAGRWTGESVAAARVGSQAATNGPPLQAGRPGIGVPAPVNGHDPRLGASAPTRRCRRRGRPDPPPSRATAMPAQVAQRPAAAIREREDRRLAGEAIGAGRFDQLQSQRQIPRGAGARLVEVELPADQLESRRPLLTSDSNSRRRNGGRSRRRATSGRLGGPGPRGLSCGVSIRGPAVGCHVSWRPCPVRPWARRPPRQTSK
jgi:hypothetical protein